MDLLHHYTEVGDPTIDRAMDYGLGLHDALADHVVGWMQALIAQVEHALRGVHRHILGELLRRLALVKRLLETWERDIRIYATAVLSAADYASRLVVRGRNSDAPAHVGTPSAPSVAELQPARVPSYSPLVDGGATPAEPPASPPPAEPPASPPPPPPPPPAEPPPPAPPPTGTPQWYFVGYCDTRTGIIVGYCQSSVGGPPFVTPPNSVLAGPFDNQADCLAWHSANTRCEIPPPPPPPPPPPGGGGCSWPESGVSIDSGSGNCCRVIGGGAGWGPQCGPGMLHCQPWVLCNTAENAIAVTWTAPVSVDDPGPPPAPGWTAVPIWLPTTQYWQWWEQWLQECGIAWDPRMLIPPAACDSWPGAPPYPPPPPPPPPPEPPGADDPFRVELCPAPSVFGWPP